LQGCKVARLQGFEEKILSLKLCFIRFYLLTFTFGEVMFARKYNEKYSFSFGILLAYL